MAGIEQSGESNNSTFKKRCLSMASLQGILGSSTQKALMSMGIMLPIALQIVDTLFQGPMGVLSP